MWSALAVLLAPVVPGALPALRPSLVGPRGVEVPMAVERWCGVVSPAERALLARARPPVLDVGCGPGRIAAYLTRQGVGALGIDVAGPAVRLARARGAPATVGSVFGPVPGSGAWGTVVLLDGNLGIGGDPGALLVRVRELLVQGGRVLCDIEAPGRPTRSLSLGLAGSSAPRQPWAQVGADGLAGVAGAAGLVVRHLWSAEGRWFAELRA